MEIKNVQQNIQCHLLGDFDSSPAQIHQRHSSHPKSLPTTARSMTRVYSPFRAPPHPIGRGGPKIHENLDFGRFGRRGARECAQNDATGCGNIFHTRQTQFWELHFSTFFGPTFEFPIDNSLSCTNCPPIAVGSNPPSQPVGGSIRLQLGQSGFLPSSPWTPV